MTAFDLAQRYIGIREIVGAKNHPLIQWWLSLCSLSMDTPDETPWCAAFANGIAWELRLPRSKSAAARSWLTVGRPIGIDEAKPEFDVVILKRGGGSQPGPEVTSGAPGHVGFFAALGPNRTVLLLGGNQNNGVTVQPFSLDLLLGVRRLA